MLKRLIWKNREVTGRLTHPFTLLDYGYYIEHLDEKKEISFQSSITFCGWVGAIKKFIYRFFHKSRMHSSLYEVSTTYREFPFNGAVMKIFQDEVGCCKPHMHIVTNNFHAVIRIDKPEYYDHGYESDIFTESQLEDFIRIMKSQIPGLDYTEWEMIAQKYDSVSDYDFDLYHMPDYSKLHTQTERR